jgi:salicylate hydroxylase/6-hydroxynicotinate 3-monooxygenase
MPSRKPKIAIVGAGMGGLTAAAALRRIGIEVEVYEQAEQFLRIGAGIQMAANPMKVLGVLGLEPRLRKIAFQPKARRSRDYDTGHLRYEYDMSGVEKRFGAPHLLIHRGDLHAALVSLLPPGTIHLGKKLAGFEQDAEGVELHFADGSCARADAVIGADGVHSAVRQGLFGMEKPRYTGRIAYRATFPALLLGDHDLGDGTTKWWGPDRHIVIYYITAQKDEVYFTTSVPEPQPDLESWSLKGDLPELRAAFASSHPDVRRVLDACPQTHKWPIYDRDPQPRWGMGRVYLLGDACHPMTPYMAQGAACALEDAAILSRSLEGIEVGGLNGALRQYEATRMPRASRIQTISHLNRRDWMRVDTAAPENATLRDNAEPDWVYSYDAWMTPLVQPELTATALAGSQFDGGM